jgi:hypothetical protein
MSDLKNQIFSLIKKIPNRVSENLTTIYVTEKLRIILWIKDDYNVEISISDKKGSEQVVYKYLELSEKEYMELKWKLEDWKKYLDNQLLDAFEEFADTDPESMDDLLND